jgi:hypothetical protein
MQMDDPLERLRELAPLLREDAGEYDPDDAGDEDEDEDDDEDDDPDEDDRPPGRH